MRQSACLVFNPIFVDDYFVCLCWGFTAQSTTRSCRAGQLIVALFLSKLRPYMLCSLIARRFIGPQTQWQPRHKAFYQWVGARWDVFDATLRGLAIVLFSCGSRCYFGYEHFIWVSLQVILNCFICFLCWKLQTEVGNRYASRTIII